MQTLFNRITCKYFGHTVYGNKALPNIVSKEQFISGQWKNMILPCDRCSEVHFVASFPIFVEISKHIEEKELAENKKRELLKMLGVE